MSNSEVPNRPAADRAADAEPARNRGPLVAILAAGRSLRFGGAKLDAPCAGRLLGEWAVEAGLNTGWPVVVVVGPGPHRFIEGNADRLAGLVVNPLPAAGLGRSLGLAAVTAANMAASLAIVTLADMPLVLPETLRQLAALASLHGVAATAWAQGRAGVPACFAPRWYSALAALEGEAGARALLQACPTESLLPLSEEELLDVDDAAGLARATGALAARAARCAGA